MVCLTLRTSLRLALAGTRLGIGRPRPDEPVVRVAQDRHWPSITSFDNATPPLHRPHDNPIQACGLKRRGQPAVKCAVNCRTAPASFVSAARLAADVIG